MACISAQVLVLLFVSTVTAAQQTATIIRSANDDPRLSWLFSQSIAPEARSELLSLFRRQLELQNELEFNRWLATAETLQALAKASASTARALTAPANNAEESAAAAKQPGATSQRPSASLSARSPTTSMLPNVARGIQIIRELAVINEQRRAAMARHHIETIGSRESSLIDSALATVLTRAKPLTDSELAATLSEAARRAAEPLTPMPGFTEPSLDMTFQDAVRKWPSLGLDLGCTYWARQLSDAKEGLSGQQENLAWCLKYSGDCDTWRENIAIIQESLAEAQMGMKTCTK